VGRDPARQRPGQHPAALRMGSILSSVKVTTAGVGCEFGVNEPALPARVFITKARS